MAVVLLPTREVVELFPDNQRAPSVSLGPARGAGGMSAYQIAVAAGFVGNEAAWLASLVGVGGAGVEISHPTPSASWNIPHTLGRKPLVQVFLTSGEMVIADVTSTTTNVYVIFGSAQTGFVLLI